MLVHWFPSTQVDSRTRGLSSSPRHAGQVVVHFVPEGMSESYGLMSSSHSQNAYLTPGSWLCELLSSLLQEHLGGPEAQLSPTEHRLALEIVQNHLNIQELDGLYCFERKWQNICQTAKLWNVIFTYMQDYWVRQKHNCQRHGTVAP